MRLLPLTIKNIPEQTPLRRMMLLHAMAGQLPLIEYTATGNPLTFDTNVSKPLKSLVIPWTPTQSGTGDPSPTNVRPISGVSGVNVTWCGTNLFDKSAVTHGKYLNSSGVETASPSGYDWCITDYIPVIGNGKISYRGLMATGSSPYSAWYDGNKSYISSFKQYSGIKANIDVPQGAKYVRFSLLNNGSDLQNFMVVLGDTIGDHVAYNGTTIPVVFPALGKNLFDISNATIVGGYMGTEPGKAFFVESVYSKIFIIPITGGKTYTVSRKNKATRFTAGTTEELRISGSFDFVDYTSYLDEGNSEKLLHITTSETTKYLYVWFYRSQSDDDYDATLEQMMVEEGSTASAYQPFTNAILEGSLHLTTGVLTAKRMMLTLTGADSWSVSGTNKFYVSINTLITGNFVGSTSTEDQYCNIYQFGGISASGSAGVTTDKRFYLQRVSATENPQWNRVWVYDTGYTLEQFKEVINTTPLQVTYPIKMKAWQLTPEQINTLIGTNVIWTDTNGSNTAKYLKKG